MRGYYEPYNEKMPAIQIKIPIRQSVTAGMAQAMEVLHHQGAAQQGLFCLCQIQRQVYTKFEAKEDIAMISFSDKVCRICGRTKADGAKFLPNRRMCNECISRQQRLAYLRRLSGSPALTQGAGCRWERFPDDPVFKIFHKRWEKIVKRIAREEVLIRKAGYSPSHVNYLTIETVISKPDLKARQISLEIEKWNKSFGDSDEQTVHE